MKLIGTDYELQRNCNVQIPKEIELNLAKLSLTEAHVKHKLKIGTHEMISCRFFFLPYNYS